MHMLLGSDTTVLNSSVGIYKIWMDWNVTSTKRSSSLSSKMKKVGKKLNVVQRISSNTCRQWEGRRSGPWQHLFRFFWLWQCP